MPEMTPEQAREMGRQGGLASGRARRKRSQLRNDIVARAKFEDVADEMATLLIKAAKGQGEFAGLDPKVRAGFALKALEYGIGRPRASEPDAPDAVEEQMGLAFQVKDDQRVLDALAGVETKDTPDGG